MNMFLPGFGCPDCGGTCASKQAVPGARLNGLQGADDQPTSIMIGGKQYRMGDIMDKTLFAAADVNVYGTSVILGTKLDWNKPSWVVKKGDAIGKVYSYITSPRGIALQFYPKGAPDIYSYYVVSNDKIDTKAIQNTGVKTEAEVVKEKEQEELKENSPIEYYIKKYGVPALLIIGGIILVGKLGGAAITGALARKKEG